MQTTLEQIDSSLEVPAVGPRPNLTLTVGIIDEALGRFSHREILSAGEVTNLLLDMRVALGQMLKLEVMVAA